MCFLGSGGGAGGWVGIPGWSAIVYMSLGMFRGKESSNRIELSWLVQDLLNFGVLGSLRLWDWGVGGWGGGGWGGGWMGWGVGGWGGGGWGVPPHMCTCTCTRMHTCTCTHMHTHACMHGKHDNFMQMATPIGGIPGNSLWCHMHMRVHVHACAHMWGAPSHHPPPPSTHPHPRGTPRISQNSIALELIEIFQFRLKIWNLWRLPHPWVGVWFGGWVGRLMGGVRSKR